MERDLERLVDERLKRLPGPRAPHTLRPRVMAAVEGRRPRPGMRPWFAWPRAWQAAFVSTLVVGVVGAGLLLSNATAIAGWVPAGWGGGVIAGAMDAVRDAQATSDALRIVLRAFVSQPIVLAFVALVIVMTTACATFGALLGRMANLGVQGAE